MGSGIFHRDVKKLKKYDLVLWVYFITLLSICQVLSEKALSLALKMLFWLKTEALKLTLIKYKTSKQKSPYE